jgi:hypothetical protein
VTNPVPGQFYVLRGVEQLACVIGAGAHYPHTVRYRLLYAENRWGEQVYQASAESFLGVATLVDGETWTRFQQWRREWATAEAEVESVTRLRRVARTH